MTLTKICGITTPDTLKAACDAGARFIGFVFYPPSPRNISPENAADLIRQLPSGVRAVGLFVNPTNESLEHVLSTAQIDMIQLHGDETPGRVKEIKERFNLPVITAIRVADEHDLAPAYVLQETADWLLFDALTHDASLPGGMGRTFDWMTLKGKNFTKPVMLSGGLNADNVKDAITLLNPDAVDVSSGVEHQKGVKDIGKIKAFITAVKDTSNA
jgi:phosphoribosylanthranilate isomerase